MAARKAPPQAPPRIFEVLTGLAGSLYKPLGTPGEPNPNFPPPAGSFQLSSPPALSPEQYVQISQLIRLYLDGNYPQELVPHRLRSPSNFEAPSSSTPDLADFVSAEQVGACLAALRSSHRDALEAPEEASPERFLEALDAFWGELKVFL